MTAIPIYFKDLYSFSSRHQFTSKTLCLRVLKNRNMQLSSQNNTLREEEEKLITCR